MAERALGGGDVLGFPRPGPLRRCLQRSAVRKSYVPWQRTHPADGVKMRSRFLVRLPAGEECNARNSGWHAGLEHAHGFFGDLLDRCLSGRFLPRHRHIGLERHAFECDAVVEKLLEGLLQHPGRHLDTAVDRVVAVHQHFGLDDRYDVFVLAERRIARQRMRIGHDASVARQLVLLPDIDDCAPFRKLRAKPAIFNEPLAQSVESFGDDFARTEGRRLRALVDLDAGNRTCFLDQLDQGRAVFGVLPDRLVVENDAGNVFSHPVGATEQHLAVVAPRIGGALDPERIEALLDGRIGFVYRQNAAAGSDHGGCDLVQFVQVHRVLLDLSRRRCGCLSYSSATALVC